MTAYTPRHAFSVPRQLPELEPAGPRLSPGERFFRWLMRRAQRKPAVPAVAAAGADAALPAGAEPVLRNGTIAEARARQDAWTAEDVAVTGHPATAPAGFPATAPAQQGAVPGGGPLPRRIPSASVREHGTWS